MKDPSAAVTDKIIKQEIAPGSRVIDLGCGDGRLLRLLQNELHCQVQGVELDEEEFNLAISQGIPVICGDLDEGLQYLPDNSFDFAVLSQTLQQLRYPVELLDHILRVARRVLVVVPNFAYWRIRLQVLFWGRGSGDRRDALRMAQHAEPASDVDAGFSRPGKIGAVSDRERASHHRREKCGSGIVGQPACQNGFIHSGKSRTDRFVKGLENRLRFCRPGNCQTEKPV